MIIYAEKRLRGLFSSRRGTKLQLVGRSENSVQFMREYKQPLSLIYGEISQCNPFTLVCPEPLSDFFLRCDFFYLHDGVFSNDFQSLEPKLFYVPGIILKNETVAIFPYKCRMVLSDWLVDDDFSQRVPAGRLEDLFIFMSSVIKGSGFAESFQEEMVPPEILAVCGCGPGLTPSGDDFLCGLFLCLRLFGRADCLSFSRYDFCRQTLFYTNRLSAAFLRSALLGYCSLRQYDLLQALRGDCLTTQLLSDFKFGHYSALDFLQGVSFAGRLLQQFFVQTGDTDTLP